MKREEDQIQRAIIKALRVLKHRDVCFFAVPNGGLRSPKEAAVMHGLGVRAGVPDLLMFRGGRAYALELKRARGGRVTPHQKLMHEEMEVAGVTVATAHGFDEALATIERWGLLRCSPSGIDGRAA